MAEEASRTARSIIYMREDHRSKIQMYRPGSINRLALLDLLFAMPYMSVPVAAAMLEVSYPTARSLIAGFEDIGLVKEIIGRERNRVFSYEPYLDILEGSIGVPS